MPVRPIIGSGSTSPLNDILCKLEPLQVCNSSSNNNFTSIIENLLLLWSNKYSKVPPQSTRRTRTRQKSRRYISFLHPSLQAMVTTTKDVVFIRNVSIEAVVGLDGWGRPKPQPVLLSVKIPYPRDLIEAANVSDDIKDCLDYRKIYKALRSLDNQTFEGIFDLANQAARQIAQAGNETTKMEMTVLLPNGLVQSEGVSAHLHISENGSVEAKYCEIHKLVIPCVLGIGDHERPRKQPVVVDLKLDGVDFAARGPSSTLEYERVFQVRPILLQVQQLW